MLNCRVCLYVKFQGTHDRLPLASEVPTLGLAVLCFVCLLVNNQASSLLQSIEYTLLFVFRLDPLLLFSIIQQKSIEFYHLQTFCTHLFFVWHCCCFSLLMVSPRSTDLVDNRSQGLRLPLAYPPVRTYSRRVRLEVVARPGG